MSSFARSGSRSRPRRALLEAWLIAFVRRGTAAREGGLEHRGEHRHRISNRGEACGMPRHVHAVFLGGFLFEYDLTNAILNGETPCARGRSLQDVQEGDRVAGIGQSIE